MLLLGNMCWKSKLLLLLKLSEKWAVTDFKVQSISALRLSCGETNEAIPTDADLPLTACVEQAEVEFLP